MLMENQPELLALLAGCGYAGFTLFGLNTGLRGDTLAGVIDQSEAPLLIVGERFLPEVERVRERLEHVAPENILVVRGGAEAASEGSDLEVCLSAEVGKPGESLDTPSIDVAPDTAAPSRSPSRVLTFAAQPRASRLKSFSTRAR